MPIVFEGDEVEDAEIKTSRIEILCLSSDSNPRQGEELDSNSSHIGEEDVLILGFPKEGRSRKDLFGGAGKIAFNIDVGSKNNNRASREGVSEGSMYFSTKSTADVTASHLESLVDVSSSECICETISSKVNSAIGGGTGLNQSLGAPEMPLRGFSSLSVSVYIP